MAPCCAPVCPATRRPGPVVCARSGLVASGWRVAALAAGTVLSAPVSAFASGMPQLDFANPLTMGQVWWGAGIFLVFFLLARSWGLPQVAAVLDQRAAAIAADLETARKAKAESDRAVAEVGAATVKARAEAQAAITAALDAVKQQEAVQTAALNAKLDAQLKDAEAQIGAARASALRALRQVATEAAATVVLRLTGSAADPARLDRALTSALAGRGAGGSSNEAGAA